MPVGPVAQWRRATLSQALTIHVVANLSASVWDAMVAGDTATWTAVSLVTNLLVEAFFIWRLWAGGRVAWWVGLVIQAFALVFLPIMSANPALFDYPAGTRPLAMLPLLLLTAAGIAAWVAPSVRRHVRGLVPAASRS